MKQLSVLSAGPVSGAGLAIPLPVVDSVLEAVSVELITSVAVQDRQVGLQVVYQGSVIAQAGTLAAVAALTASLTWQISFAPELEHSSYVVTLGTQAYTLGFPQLSLPAGAALRVTVTGVDLSDVLTAKALVRIP